MTRRRACGGSIDMRKTKIICTLGPATSGEDVLRQLMENGMNTARLNFSHGTHDDHRIMADKVKKIRDDMGIPLALLLDTKGPKIRIRKFENKQAEVKKGELFRLTSDDIVGNSSAVSLTYAGLPGDVKPGDMLLIDDGLISMKVEKKDARNIECRVVNGGILKDGKGVNVPGVKIKLPYMSDADRKDILFGIENDFDYLAASFVRDAQCVNEVRKVLEDNGGAGIKIIAKIENREGIDNIEEILRVSDGIMIARGDMGVEIPFEELPHIQKDIIRRCNQKGKPVVTATQMLDSMIRNPRPTRAETTDVANAVYDGTDAIMLSGETSVGEYPVEAVKTMSKIAVEAEMGIDYIDNFSHAHMEVSRNITNAISHATCLTAHSLGAAAIIAVTSSGRTANMITKYRPACPVIAATVARRVYRQLSLAWGVCPVMGDVKNSTDEILEHSIQKAHETCIVGDGDLVVITGGMIPGVSGTTNTLKVHIIGDILARGKGTNGLKASGPVFVMDDSDNAARDFNAGDVIVISRTTDLALSVMKHAAAVVTEEEGEHSRAVSAGKALHIPVLSGVAGAAEILKNGTIVTVDAAGGYVYAGIR